MYTATEKQPLECIFVYDLSFLLWTYFCRKFSYESVIAFEINTVQDLCFEISYKCGWCLTTLKMMQLCSLGTTESTIQSDKFYYVAFLSLQSVTVSVLMHSCTIWTLTNKHALQNCNCTTTYRQSHKAYK